MSQSSAAPGEEEASLRVLSAAIHRVVRDKFQPVAAVSAALLKLEDDRIEAALEAESGLSEYFRKRSDVFEVRRNGSGQGSQLLVRSKVPPLPPRDDQAQIASKEHPTSERASDVLGSLPEDPTLDELRRLVPVDLFISVDELFKSLSSSVKRRFGHSEALQQQLSHHPKEFLLSIDRRLVVRLKAGVQPPDVLHAMSTHSLSWPAPQSLRHGEEKSVVVAGVQDAWDSIDPAEILPFVPGFFVPWATVFELLPQPLRERMPKHRRSEYLVSHLLDYCDFVVKNTVEGLKLRLKADCRHPKADATKAEQLYSHLRVDESALEELATVLPLEEVDLADPTTFDLLTSPQLRARLWPKSGTGRIKLFHRFPFAFVGSSRQTVCSLRTALQVPPAADPEDTRSVEGELADAVRRQVQNHGGSLRPHDLATGLGSEMWKRLREYGGIGRLLARYRHSLALDDVGNLACTVTAARINRLGTLLSREAATDVPATLEELDDFRFNRKHSDRKAERRVALFRQKRYSRDLRDPDLLLQHIASYVPKEGYIRYEDLNQSLGDEAKCHLRSTLLRYLLCHPKVFDVKEDVSARRVEYSIRRRAAGEEPAPNEYDGDDEALLSVISLHVHPTRGISLFHLAPKLPNSARVAMRAKCGSLIRYIHQFPEIFTVCRAENQQCRLWIFLTNTATPDGHHRVEAGELAQNDSEDERDEE